MVNSQYKMAAETPKYYITKYVNEYNIMHTFSPATRTMLFYNYVQYTQPNLSQ